MRFTDAYAGYSVCAPSRRTLMSGYHVGHFGDNGSMLSNKSVTVARLLQRAGYATRLIGPYPAHLPRAPKLAAPRPAA